MKSFLVIMAACCLTIDATQLRAETLEPLAVQYGTDVKQDPEAAACYFIVALTNYPRSPEVVKLSLSIAAARRTRTAGVALLFDVFDVDVKDGRTVGSTVAPLADAALYSPNFNSSGRMYGGPIADGGVQLSTQNAEVATALEAAVLQGDFTIEFRRKGAPTTRSYRVHERPSIDVIKHYTKCTNDVIKPIVR